MGTIAAPADGIAAARLWEDSQISPQFIDAVGDVMIEFVERPRPPALTDERRALLETATNGKAIVVELNGRPSRRMQNTLRAWLRTQGLPPALQAQPRHVLPHLLG